MTHALTLWLAQWTGAGAMIQARPAEQQPMKIEVERLPDYLWRELGFPPRRSHRE